MQDVHWLKIKELFHQTLDLSKDERDRFLATQEPDLRAEIVALIASHEQATDFIDEPAPVVLGFAEDGMIGSFVGDYKIVDLTGKGGMGQVFLAEKKGIDKKFALKLIKRGMDTDAVLDRFVRERQILSQLEHQYIAGLIDVGSTEDGLPYFVMEYVEGMPLTKFCDENKLDLKKRLEIFQKACDAVKYAHANLIVHRDIKPSNILVKDDGTPKLLDFGVAKLLSTDEIDATTALQSRMLTPEYASPEQLGGMPITTATDVYSLGVVLYELLSGVRPFSSKQNSYRQIADIVLTQEPPRPSSAIDQQALAFAYTSENHDRITKDDVPAKRPGFKSVDVRSLRGDLDNIILKALRKEPERRYQSVQEFSDDIRRHLDGLPVTAVADTKLYRIGKFVKRHRAGVFAGGVIFLTILAATALTTWQAIVARREQAKAVQRFNEVRQLANTVLFEYHDGIARLPGSTTLREKMVKDALLYLDKLAAENFDDTELQGELAAAYFKVGEVQGAPTRSSLGDYGGGLDSFKKSLAIREELFGKDPNNEQVRLDLVRSYQMVGHLSQVTDNVPDALVNYQKAFAIFDSMSLESPEAKRDFATLHTRYAQALSATGEHDKGLENFYKAVALMNELLAADPANRDIKRDLGIAYGQLGDALEEAADPNAALDAQRSSFAILEPLVTESDAVSKRDASSARGRVGDALFKLGRYKEALAVQTRVLATDEEILRADPSNALARRDVQVAYYKLARNQSELGLMTAALTNLRKCIEFCEAAVVANPESSEARSDLGVALFYYGSMQEKINDPRAALDTYKRATAIEEAMSNADPSNMTALSYVSEDYLKISDLALKLGNRREALDGYLKALAMRERIRTEAKETGEDRAVSANIYEGLGDYYFSLARVEKPVENIAEAINRYKQSLSVWQELKEAGKLLTKDAAKLTTINQKIAKCLKATRKR